MYDNCSNYDYVNVKLKLRVFNYHARAKVDFFLSGQPYLFFNFLNFNFCYNSCFDYKFVLGLEIG